MEDLLGRMVSVEGVPLIQDHILFEEESKKFELVNKKKKRKARKKLFDFLTFVFQPMISIDEFPAEYLGEVDGKQQIHWTSISKRLYGQRYSTIVCRDLRHRPSSDVPMQIMHHTLEVPYKKWLGISVAW